MKPEDIPGEIARKYNEYLGKELVKLSMGETLCVHETFVSEKVPDFFDNSVKIEFSLNSHVIPAGEECNTMVPRTQYGPRDWEQLPKTSQE